MNTVIEVRDLHVAYGEPDDAAGPADAVRGVSFTVERGRVHALLGEYGSGKTTVLETVAGLRRPTRGTVRVRGIDPYADHETVRMGTVWREGGLFPGLTVAEIVEAWRRWTLDPMPGDEALRMVGLDAFARVPFDRLSALDRRRLDLALALLGRSDVLFLDEPTAGLDREARREVWRALRLLADAGVTVLVSTRDLDVTRCADRVSVLGHGALVSATGPDAVTSQSEAAAAGLRRRADRSPVPAGGGRSGRSAA